jgi:aconitate hydratase
MLAMTFADKFDYDKVSEDDKIIILGLTSFTPGKYLSVELKHADGSVDKFEVLHTYNETQIEWFKSGSALNAMKK